jgi:2-amino-4-hydroxy-6-hydroxymethyldihydropteridine diphosphokinase
MRLGVGLGSNLGDRMANLRHAVGALRTQLHQDGSPFLASGVYATAPVDCAPGTPEFFNAAVELECDLPAREVLAWTRRWEESNGRPREHGFHEPRTVDLDLLYYGDSIVQDEDLILPHPRAAERLFVLAPLAEIAPRFVPPGWNTSVQEAAANLSQQAHQQQEPAPRRLEQFLLNVA